MCSISHVPVRVLLAALGLPGAWEMTFYAKHGVRNIEEPALPVIGALSVLGPIGCTIGDDECLMNEAAPAFLEWYSNDAYWAPFHVIKNPSGGLEMPAVVEMVTGAVDLSSPMTEDNRGVHYYRVKVGIRPKLAPDPDQKSYECPNQFWVVESYWQWVQDVAEFMSKCDPEFEDCTYPHPNPLEENPYWFMDAWYSPATCGHPMPILEAEEIPKPEGVVSVYAGKFPDLLRAVPDPRLVIIGERLRLKRNGSIWSLGDDPGCYDNDRDTVCRTDDEAGTAWPRRLIYAPDIDPGFLFASDSKNEPIVE